MQVAEGVAAGKACVYATGSYGRGEASKYSDLDLFIVGKKNGKLGQDGTEGSLLSRLDDIRIKADLIETTREMGIQEFSGDGRYLVHYSVHQLIKTLGKAEDDALNTFTARLLLLLESRPLLESAVYDDVIEEVVAAYWRDYEGHKSDFVPAFLANDILRLWRTFCVNYEANTSTEPSEENAKRKLKNYKLKHSRLLTCYSALLYLLVVFAKSNTVSPDDTLEMICLTPTQRLEWMLAQPSLVDAHPAINKTLDQYAYFLQTTNAPEDELIKRFLDREMSKKYMISANAFGESIFDVLNLVGGNTKLHRMLIV